MGLKTNTQQKRMLTLLLFLILGSVLLWGFYWLFSYINHPDLKDLQAQKEELNTQFLTLSSDLIRLEKMDMPTNEELTSYVRKVTPNEDLSSVIRQLQRLSNLTGLQLQSINVGTSQTVSIDFANRIYSFIQAEATTPPVVTQELSEEEFIRLISESLNMNDSDIDENALKLKQTTLALSVVGTDAQLQNFLTCLKELDRIVHVSYINFVKGQNEATGSASLDMSIYHYVSDLLPKH